MPGEKAGGEADLVSDENSKYQADETGCHPEVLPNAGKAPLPKREGRSHRQSNQHHSQDCTDAEDHQISQGPGRRLNRAQDEERDGSRSGEAVHDPDCKRTKRTIERQAPEDAIETADRGRLGRMLVLVIVSMNVVAVSVIMRVGMRV